MTTDEFLRVRAFHLVHMFTYGRATLHECAVRYGIPEERVVRILESQGVYVWQAPLRRERRSRDRRRYVWDSVAWVAAG